MAKNNGNGEVKKMHKNIEIQTKKKYDHNFSRLSLCIKTQLRQRRGGGVGRGENDWNPLREPTIQFFMSFQKAEKTTETLPPPPLQLIIGVSLWICPF